LLVQSANGSGVPGAWIQAAPEAESDYYSKIILAKTDAAGRADLGFDGSWPDRIVVSHPDFIPQLRKLNRNAEEERVVLKSGLSIHGVLRGEEGRPMPDIIVQASTSDLAERDDLFVSNSLLYESMRPLDSGADAMAFYKNEGRTDAQGRFSIRGLVDSTYHLNLKTTRFVLNRPSSFAAGRSDVNLTARRVSSIRVKCRDASTGGLIENFICFLDVSGGSKRTTIGSGSGGGEWRIGYEFSSRWPKTLEVIARVQARGYDDGRTTTLMDRLAEETVISLQLAPSDRRQITLHLSWANGVPCRDSLSYSAIRVQNRSKKMAVATNLVAPAPETEGVYRIWAQKGTAMIRVRPASVPFASLGAEVEIPAGHGSISASISHPGTVELQVNKPVFVTISGPRHVGVMELKKGKNLFHGLPLGGWEFKIKGLGGRVLLRKVVLNKRRPYALVVFP